MIAELSAAALMNISMVAARYGVSLRTLRYYESQKMLSPSRMGGVRLYSKRDCLQLELILKGKKLGLSLREVSALICEKDDAGFDSRTITSRMDADQLQDRLRALQSRRDEIDKSIDELIGALDQHRTF